MLAFFRSTLKDYAIRHFSNQEKTNDLLIAIESRLPVVCPHCQAPLAHPQLPLLPNWAYNYKNGEPAPYTDQELVTVKEAEGLLEVSPDKLYRMRVDEELTSLYRKRNVRLIRTEVEAAYEWYTKKKK